MKRIDRLVVLLGALALLTSCGGSGGGDGGSGDEVRFVNCGNGTVEDRETGLLWEEKTGDPSDPDVQCVTADGGCEDPHDVNNRYTWTFNSDGTVPDGAAFTDFLPRLNGLIDLTCFAGHCNWELPTMSQLQSIQVGPGVEEVARTLLADPDSGTNPTGQATVCDDPPCIDPAFAEVGGPTKVDDYWSSDTAQDRVERAWYACFELQGTPGCGNLQNFDRRKVRASNVRAVRTGSCTD